MSRLVVAAVPLLLAVCAAAALMAVALAGSGEDVEDPSSDCGDPGPAQTPDGPAFEAMVEGSVVLLPYAKRMEDALCDVPRIAVRVQATSTTNAVSALCAGVLEVALADRRMTTAERATCRKNDVEPLRVQLGYGSVELFGHATLGLECLRLRELRALWRPGSPIERYAELRRGLPDRPVRLIAPAARYPSFRYFTARVVGQRGAIRRDADLVSQLTDLRDEVAGTPSALGFGPIETDAEHGDPVGAVEPVAIDFGHGCVEPTARTVVSGAYELRRPLNVYIGGEAVRRPAVKRVARYVRTAVLEGYPGIVPARP